MVLNIAGPEYDFGSVVFAVLQECEHRRRGFDRDETEFQLKTIARKKLNEVKAAYNEFGGSPTYWEKLEGEVLNTALPQYIAEAEKMNELERNGFGVWRNGDTAARFVFALIGLILGSIIIAIPFIPIFEAMFAFALTGAGFLYPDIQRYVHERRHARFLNQLINESVAYQTNARLHYMTHQQIQDSFSVSEPTLLDTTTTTTTPRDSDVQT
jgi:hypothetical protein